MKLGDIPSFHKALIVWRVQSRVRWHIATAWAREELASLIKAKRKRD